MPDNDPMSNRPAAQIALDYSIADVFTDTALAGNPVAVVTDSIGLPTERMQAIAREFNLSETTFVERRPAAVEQAEGVRVRIFTTQEELPFAGHPTLGTASVLKVNAPETAQGDTVTLALNVGPVPVRFEDQARNSAALFGEMTQRDPEFGKIHDANEVAKATDLSVDQLDLSAPIQTVSTGFAFAIVPLRSLATLERLQLDLRKAYAYLANTDARHFYFVVRDRDRELDLRARMLFYGGEDPATGSAAGCTAAWMVRHGLAKPDQEVVIAQGIEMGRPSDIFVRASLEDTRVRNVRVGGYCAEVMRGELTLP